MSRPSRFGVTLPQIKRSWDEARSAALEFDSLGYDSVWVCDHVYGVPAPQLPIFEAWTELAAVAALTKRVELGTLVTPPFFRNPAILAKQVATLDHVSNGRAIVGLGAGWFKPEFEATGSAFPPLGARMQALEETCQILKGLFTQERTTFEGQHFQVRDAIAEVQQLAPLLQLVGDRRGLLGRLDRLDGDAVDVQEAHRDALDGIRDSIEPREILVDGRGRKAHVVEHRAFAEEVQLQLLHAPTPRAIRTSTWLCQGVVGCDLQRSVAGCDAFVPHLLSVVCRADVVVRGGKVGGEPQRFLGSSDTVVVSCRGVMLEAPLEPFVGGLRTSTSRPLRRVVPG